MSDAEDAAPEYVVVPPEALSPRALVGLVEEFIMREGTDYGPRVHSFEEKRTSVLRLIEAGEVAIVFDPKSESTTLQRTERRS